MNYTLSQHVLREIARRGIPLPLVEAVLEEPAQIVPARGATKAYQSRCEIGGKMFLLRVIVDDSADPAVVITAYRTSKIAKYWEVP